MKRELAFAIQTQCQLNGSLGRTRSSKIQAQSGDFNELSEGSSRKRFKGSQAWESNGEIDGSQENIQGCNDVAVYRRTRRFKNADPVIEEIETVIEEKKCNFVTPICEDKNKNGFTEASSKEDSSAKPTVDEEGSKVVPMPVDKSNEAMNAKNSQVINDGTNKVMTNMKHDGKSDGFVEAPRRFTRSVLNSKTEVGLIECTVSVATGNETVLNGEVNVSTAVSALGTQTKKLELKMSKKIPLNKKPRTIKELFSTGLLEGYSVFYNSRDKGSTIRGVIKDRGILCFCSLCEGCRVVNPCQFEIHACKSYKRAAQYICLENGKSLLEVVKACRNSSLDLLEETIQSVIGPLQSIICPNCKGSFLTSRAATAELICPSCVSLKSLEATSTHTTDTNARSSKPILALRKSTRSAKVVISSQDMNQESIKDSSSKPSLILKANGNGSAYFSAHRKSQEKLIKKSLKPALAPKCSGNAWVHVLSRKKTQGRMKQKSSKAVFRPRSSKSPSQCISSQKKSKWKITKKDQRLHRLVFEDDGLPDGTEVGYYIRGQKLLEGYKRGPGIFCRCCNSEVSPSQFESHAGWASRKKPYQNIYTSNGVSLHEFAISLLKGRKHFAKDNDDLCTICADGGNLLLCDICPRAFHIECASLSSIPHGKWYCKYCQNMFQREKFVEHNINALAAGRVSGVDPIEQITKRCIRIVKSPEDAEVIACVLCRGNNFRKTGFGPFTVIVCDQCEKEYHVGCLKKHKMADLKELPKGKWFCCMDCSRIYSSLQNLLIRGEEMISDSLLDVIKKKHEDKVSDTPTDFDVRWRVLSGKIASPETRLLLSKSVAIFHDCFDPIVDSTTGRDFIPSMVYGRNIRGQDFGGMYCAVLTLNSSVISAGIFRVFGQEIAELPLVATSNNNQGKGYFQVLFSCIEKLLAFLNVKCLVLPAAEEAESIWTQKFGFEKIPLEQLSEYRKSFWQMLTFQGSSMLQKPVLQCPIIQQDVDASMKSS
ncbi:uncharacterized protein LOC130765875 isoform X1 [Actinidia eriantha]|uniref:uncharacterized protein LOC130765875 isoform X1 n=1 Tax=Actinidia eriantha TaxID=165200 RepID=UPI0025904A2A|nr:uncharacterized protein LOC130765875 isoform X1 [Actinidia eriantha]XP_057478448.1 uncharacterized protein LOC130765875 isoform X1 [Actinidia eriantha]